MTVGMVRRFPSLPAVRASAMANGASRGQDVPPVMALIRRTRWTPVVVSVPAKPVSWITSHLGSLLR